MNDNFVIVTFFTDKYAKFVRKWTDSIKEHDISSIAYNCEDTGDWYMNVANKPRMVLKALDDVGGKDVVWCDVDAELMAYPILLDNIDTDLAGFKVEKDRRIVRFVDRHYVWKHYNVVFSGTIYFKNNDAVRALCKDWLAYLISDEWMERVALGKRMIGDQDSFNNLIRTTHSNLTFTELPETYCYIYRRNHAVKYPEDVVFLHYVEGAVNSKYVGKRIN